MHIWWHKIGLTCLTATLAACTATTAVLNPYIEPAENAFKSTPSIANAFIYAESVRDEYGRALNDYALTNRASGIMAIGVATAAATLGISGGGSDALAALGTTGVGLVGMNSFLYREQRLKIYAEGQRAVGCVIDSYAGARNLDTEAIKNALSPIVAGINRLNSLLASVSGSALNDLRVIEARAVVNRANAIISRAASALTAGTHVYEAVRSVQAQINRALIENEPDVAASVVALNQLFSAAAVSQTAVPGTEGVHNDFADPAMEIQVRNIEQEAISLTTNVNTLEAMLVSVADVGPGLNDCAVKAEELGLAFRTDPSSLVEVTTSSRDEFGVITARGGRAPYHARWIGMLPGAGITLLPPDHDTGRANEAEIRVKVEPAAIAGTFVLSINDESNGRASVQFVVRQGTAAVAPASVPPTATVSVQQPDEILRKVQEKLISLGCLAEKKPNSDPSNDGLWGDMTSTAINKFDQGFFGGMLSQTIGDRNSTADYYSRLDAQLKSANDPTKQCVLHIATAESAGTSGATAAEPTGSASNPDTN